MSHILISNFNFLDKERYDRELKQLEGQSDSIKKPKKCLSAYMIFVKEVSQFISRKMKNVQTRLERSKFLEIIGIKF